MTQEEMQSAIRRLTKRIGAARRDGVNEAVERLRLLRCSLMERLAEDHNLWTLVNVEGHTEFVDRQTWIARMRAWMDRRLAGDSTPQE